MNLRLLSGSPRRIELLRQLGYQAQVYIPNVPEHEFEKGYDVDLHLENVRRKIDSDPYTLPHIRLAADTVVVLDNIVLGKPKDLNENRNFIHKLSGRKHLVITAFGLKSFPDHKIREQRVITEIEFRVITDQEIEAYIQTRDGLDKAGGYAIQGQAKAWLQSIKGSMSNVIGLPLEELGHALKNF